MISFFSNRPRGARGAAAVALLLGLVAVAEPVAAQRPAASARRELRKRESKAGRDPARLLEVARWARQQGLVADHRRILEKIVRRHPDFEPALRELGYVKFEGKWLPAKRAAELAAKRREAEFKARGMKRVDGVWVAPEEVEDARKGIFHHQGEVVSKQEKIALLLGKVFHPRTGELIDGKDLAKAEKGLFPIGDGRWVDAGEANRYHSDPGHPWVVRTYYGFLVTTLPLEKHDQLKGLMDGAVDTVKPLFGGRRPHPAHRPSVVVCADAEIYRELGAAIGGPGSAYGAFLAERQADDLPVSGRVAACVWEQNWGEYYLRHAAGLATANSFFAEVGAGLPEWFARGVGSLAERHFSPGVAQHFGKQHLAKGGVKDLESWLSSFAINPQMSPREIDYNVYQAGLVLAFCMRGGDEEATKALMAVTEALQKNARAVEKALARLEKLIPRKEARIRDYLRKVVQGS